MIPKLPDMSLRLQELKTGKVEISKSLLRDSIIGKGHFEDREPIVSWPNDLSLRLYVSPVIHKISYEDIQKNSLQSIINLY